MNKLVALDLSFSNLSMYQNQPDLVKDRLVGPLSDQNLAFLTSSQVMLILKLQGPYLCKNHC